MFINLDHSFFTINDLRSINQILLYMELEKRFDLPYRDSFEKPFTVFYAFFSKEEPPIYRVVGNSYDTDIVKLYNGKQYNGEDPRPFILNGRKYAVIERYYNSFHTMENAIVDVETGEGKLYKVDEPDFFYGKNWTPFVYNDELYIVHQFDPFTLLKDNKVLFKIPTNLQKNITDKYCCYRGGTNGLQISSNTVIGFGHKSDLTKRDNHVPYLWVIDFEKRVLYISEFERNEIPIRNLLLDPTSLINNNDGTVTVVIFESSEYWNIDNFNMRNAISFLKFDLNNLEQFKERGMKFSF